MASQQYKPGERVPESGIYAVLHDKNHTQQHDITAVKGETFPPCNHCGQHPRFVLKHQAHHLSGHPHFTKK